MLRKSNFKSIFCLFFLVFSFVLSDVDIWTEEHEAVAEVPREDQLRFAVWNIKRFGRDIRDKRNLEYVAKIIAEYDFVTIIELMDSKIKISEEGKIIGLKEDGEESDFMKFLEILSKKGNYDYRISPHAGYGEWYGFLFKREKFEVVKKPQLYPDAKGQKGTFTRDPCWATFRVGRFDFTVIAVHIYFGEHDTLEESKESYKRRRKEIKALAKVYEDIQEWNGQENDVLLVGDFNMDAIDMSFCDLLNKFDPKVDALFRSEWGNVSNLGRIPKLYDNIFFQSRHLREYLSGSSEIDKFHDTYFKGRKKNANWISDHLPVTAVFRTDREDDDDNTENDGAGNNSVLIDNSSASTESDSQSEMNVTVYVTSHGKKYHKDGCDSLRRSKNHILLAEAKQDGYTPCRRCSPSE